MLEKFFDENWMVVSSGPNQTLPGGIMVFPQRKHPVYWMPQGCEWFLPKAEQVYLLSPLPGGGCKAFGINNGELEQLPPAEWPDVLKRIAESCEYPASVTFYEYWRRGAAYPTCFLGFTGEPDKIDMWMTHSPLWEAEYGKLLQNWLPGSFFMLTEVYAKKALRFAVWIDARADEIQKAVETVMGAFPHVIFALWTDTYYSNRGFLDFMHQLQNMRI